MVFINGAFSTLPDCILNTASAAPSGSPPYTFKLGLKNCAPKQVPESKPPPPTGVITISRSGTSSINSFTQVACPVITL